ncbi:MAG: ABC transporter permease [Dehalococcoidia bacterium]
MTTFIIRRALAAIPLLLVVSFAVFMLVAVMPGDAAVARLGADASPDTLASLRHEMGLDRPALQRYGVWLAGAVRGDWGRSFARRTPVVDELTKRLPVTLELGAVALLIATAIGIPLGTLAALRRGSVFDLLITAFGVLGFSVPSFLVGMVLLYVAALKLRLGLPIAGWTPPTEDLVGNLRTLALPALTVGIVLAASIMRQTRSAVLDILHEDYVRTARAKGLAEPRIVRRHVLKNALSPVVTIVGLQAGILIGGLVVTEQVFSIPGMGRFLVDATRARDVPQIMAATVLTAVGIVTLNVLVDIAYTWLDPRVRVA